MNCESSERHEAEREHAGRVRHRDDAAEQERVDRTALRADEVAGDDRLAVAGRERVRGAPERRDEERQQDHAERQVAARDERLEAAAPMLGGAQAVEARRRAGPVAERERGGRRRDVERRAEQLVGIGAELVARTLGGDARSAQLGPVLGVDDDLAPADPRAEVAVAEREPRAAAVRDVDGVEPQRFEARRRRGASRGAVRAAATGRVARRPSARGSAPPRAAKPRRGGGRRAATSGSRPRRARSGRRSGRRTARSSCAG